jgi:hypothetical protein
MQAVFQHPPVAFPGYHWAWPHSIGATVAGDALIQGDRLSLAGFAVVAVKRRRDLLNQSRRSFLAWIRL